MEQEGEIEENREFMHSSTGGSGTIYIALCKRRHNKVRSQALAQQPSDMVLMLPIRR